MKSLVQVIVALLVTICAIAAAALIIEALNLPQATGTGTGIFVFCLIIAIVISGPALYRVVKSLIQKLKKRFARPEISFSFFLIFIVFGFLLTTGVPLITMKFLADYIGGWSLFPSFIIGVIIGAAVLGLGKKFFTDLF